MKVKFYGTRGSTPVCHPGNTRYGGNTTCLRVDSACLPEGTWLVVDAGSGIVPLSWDFAAARGRGVCLLLSHFHHDHTGGLLLTPFPYNPKIPLDIVGPRYQGIGPCEVYRTLMQPPWFPVSFEAVAAGHVRCHEVEPAEAAVLVIHPRAGVRLVARESLERALGGEEPMQGADGEVLDPAECMVVRMHRSNHPEQTISFRFEELGTGRTFVFVTDHENEESISPLFRAHLQGADLLVMDCQYTREKYERFTTGYGHATPDYVAWVSREVGIRHLGLTHHDPPATDADLDRMVETVQALLPEAKVFGCQDYQEVDIGAPSA